MILRAAGIIKVLTILIMLLFFWRKCAKKESHVFRNWIMIAILLIAFLAHLVTLVIPPLSDTVVLTALGKKNSVAKRDEVFLNGYRIDGKDYQINSKTLKIIEGKWFWGGDYYCWRNEKDVRQPAGTTRSIKIAVPVGWDRSILFKANEWRGYVEIRSGDQIKVIDTSVIAETHISRSQTKDLILNQVRKLFAFCAVMLIGSMTLNYIINHTEKVSVWARNNKWYLIYAGIALAQFVFAVSYSSVQSFWLDEMYEIGWSETSNNILERMLVDMVPRPIYGFFFYLWYKIAPYGESWLLLPMEIATAIGIYFCALCAKKQKDGKAGAFAGAFASISSITLLRLSYEIRSYAFYFCFGTILLYLNLQRWNHPGKETIREIICATVIMTIFAGMHAHAVIICFLFFCIDLYQYLKYKIKIRCLVPYCVAACSYIPVIIIMIRNIQSGYFNVDGFWTPVPTLSLLVEAIKYICGNLDIVLMFFVLALACLLSERKVSSNDKKKVCIQKDIPKYLMFVCIGHVLIMYIYGNIRTQTTLWSNRYFVGIIPIVFTISACSASAFCDWLSDVTGKQHTKRYISRTATIFLLLVILLFGYNNLLPKQVTKGKRFRETADYLYAQTNAIYRPDTVVIGTSGKNNIPIIGWNEYYMKQLGRRDSVNVISTVNVSSEDLKGYNTVYTVAFHNSHISSQLQEILDTEFTLVQNRSDLPIKEYTRNSK